MSPFLFVLVLVPALVAARETAQRWPPGQATWRCSVRSAGEMSDVKAVLKQGANVNACSTESETPLTFAAVYANAALGQG